MFNIGMPELIIIFIVALLVIGPKKLPDLARSLGRGFREFKKATSDLQDSFRVDEFENLDKEESTAEGEGKQKAEAPPAVAVDSSVPAEGAPLEARPPSETGPSGKEVMAESEEGAGRGHVG